MEPFKILGTAWRTDLRGRRRGVVTGILLCILAFSAISCEPDSLLSVSNESTTVQAYLDEFEVSLVETPSGPMVWVWAASADSVDNRARIPVTLTTDQDTLVAQLSLLQCRAEGLAGCRRLFAWLNDGNRISEVQAVLAPLDAAIVIELTLTSGGDASANADSGSAFCIVEVFSGSGAAVLRRLREHPAVHIAEPTVPGGTPAVGGISMKTYVGVTVPTSDNSPTPPSARLRLLPGQTLRATYVQPDGAVLESHMVIPAQDASL